MSSNAKKFENRFKSYGIVEDNDELEEFVANAEHTAKMFFEEEGKAALKLGETLFNKDLGEKFFDELVLRFTIGFCEGAIFRSLQLASNLLSEGYSEEDVIRITKMPLYKIRDLKQNLKTLD